jgi:hypothetical protein
MSESGLVYIGCGWGKTAERRWACHLRSALRDTHCGSPLLAEKIRDGEVFTLEVLERGSGTRAEAFTREEHHLHVELAERFDAVLNRNLQPTRPGFNPSHPATRAKLRDAAARRWADPEQRVLAAEAARIRSNRPEHLERMRTDNPSRYVTAEVRAEINRKNRGKVRSEESRARYAAASREVWARSSREPTYCSCGAGPFRGPRAVQVHQRWKHREN